MQLRDFIEASGLLSAREIEKVTLFAYFHLRTFGIVWFADNDIGDWFTSAELPSPLPRPNPSRLRDTLRKSKAFHQDPALKKFALHPIAVTELDSRFPELARGIHRSTAQKFKSGSHNFVHDERIQQLKTLQSDNFDFSRLIRLCEELNTAALQDCRYAVVMLTRAVIDHVPPVFGAKSFGEVANNYAGRSLRDSLQHLERSCRSIADQHLHLHIRKKEVLPTLTQVDFSNDLDVLLGEVVRTVK